MGLWLREYANNRVKLANIIDRAVLLSGEANQVLFFFWHFFAMETPPIGGARVQEHQFEMASTEGVPNFV